MTSLSRPKPGLVAACGGRPEIVETGAQRGHGVRQAQIDEGQSPAAVLSGGGVVEVVVRVFGAAVDHNFGVFR